ncbi:putative F-box/LRR-repeat protein At5g02930 [Lactuca sativa]|uniref:putative F-box/LRR-repeat protein At5g02930 n=1 Tax=Lactuca sativa TaxID=4236 RepID=UPI000CD9F0F0|nr:putative F-box/LRR-repeat protein At5g02930 [Lactuca sativa]
MFKNYRHTTQHRLSSPSILLLSNFFAIPHSPRIMHNNDLVGSVRKRKKSMDVEGGDDRLSSLTDDLIHEIFSFMSIKDAIRTCVLSSRWKFIWTSMPDFENLNDRLHLSKFISNVLSNRNKKIQVSSVSLLLGRTVKDDESVSRILSFAFSHNLQQLSVIRAPGDSIRFPYSFIVTPKWDLPALTTLHLHCVKLMSDDLFSKCTNLKSLILKECTLMEEMEVLSICHPRLSDLTLVSTPPDMELQEGVNVVAPQLKNLTIKWCRGEHLISAPGLTSLVIVGFHPCQSFTCTKPGFHSLEKVRLYFYDAGNADAHKIVSLLQQLHSVKLLTLNLQILQRLFSIEVRPRFRNVKRRMSKSTRFSSGMEVSPYKTCVLANAKIVKFVPSIQQSVYLEKVTTCTEIKKLR